MSPARFAMIRMQSDMSNRIRNVCLHTKRKTRECLKVHAESLLRRARALVSGVWIVLRNIRANFRVRSRVMRTSDTSLEMVTRLSAASDVCTVRCCCCIVFCSISNSKTHTFQVRKGLSRS